MSEETTTPCTACGNSPCTCAPADTTAPADVSAPTSQE